MKKVLFLILLMGFSAGAHAASLSDSRSDKEVRQAMIAGSIASYPGKCACPYSRMSSGRACGGRSAYSKAGGYETLCYEKDISAEMLANYKVQYS